MIVYLLPRGFEHTWGGGVFVLLDEITAYSIYDEKSVILINHFQPDLKKINEE